LIKEEIRQETKKGDKLIGTTNYRISHVRLKFLILFFIAPLLFGCFKTSDEPLIEYTSDEGRFSVSMPGKPVKRIEKVSTPVGTIAMYEFLVEKPEIAYVVAYADYPNDAVQNSDPEKILDSAKKGAMQNIGGKITQEDDITYGEDPGRELHFSAKGGLWSGQAVLLLSGNRLYQVLAIGSKLTYPEKIVQEYIDSFEIW
jgi:hypothetical protein